MTPLEILLLNNKPCLVHYFTDMINEKSITIKDSNGNSALNIVIKYKNMNL